jgi:propane monooxygenase reductase component
VLNGDDIELDKYSTFALPDYELEEGYTLLCRAHAYEDVTIELLNFDEEMIRSGLPIIQGVAEVVSKDAVTHDMRHLTLRLLEPQEIKFFPGQYMDFAIPGTDATRSFSMANTSSRESGLLEFVIKVYPDGKFSRFLAEKLAEGDRLDLSGPFGVFTLRDGENDLVFVGGGAGMAPILALLRHMSETANPRPVRFYYGARTAADLFYLDEIARLGKGLVDFTFVACLSDTMDGALPEQVHVEEGFVTDIVARHEGDIGKTEVYLCGPPPMVDAALAMLDSRAVPKDQVFYDSFTSPIFD